MVFVVLAIFLLNGLERDPNAMPSALIDRPVPVFSLPVLGDETRSVTEVLFQGEPALLNVWATWCVACRIEHPFLNKLADQGIRIIGLNYKDDNAAARKWLMDKGDPYALSVIDARGRMGLNLGVFGAPETYIVDRTGTIRYKHIGVVDERIWRDKLLPIWQKIQ
jgi:cytochrome c biogenesis protein CcmG, thiol:disulfide interchange protein DsbE